MIVDDSDDDITSSDNGKISFPCCFERPTLFVLIRAQEKNND